MPGLIYRQSSRVLHSALADGETVLLHLETGQYHELNRIGATIWGLIDGERSVAAITARMEELVDDPPGDLGDIVAAYIDELRRRDLIG